MAKQLINTAICSFGMSGKLFHAPFIHALEGLNLYGVLERTNKIAHETYPDIKSFDTLDEMLADEDIDLVVVNTPNATHFNYAEKALEAGKHVVVEKPFVLDVEEGRALIKLAEKVNKKLAVYQNRRWDSDFISVQEIVQSNRLGAIVEAELHYDRFRPELSSKIHKEGLVPGSGLLWDLGPHLIDQALVLFGIPEAVFADLAVMRPKSLVTDYFEIVLFYEAKRVRLKASNLVKQGIPAFTFYGTKGSFLKPRADVQERDLLAGKPPVGSEWGTEEESDKGILTEETNNGDKVSFITSKPSNYINFYKSMVEAIVNNAPVPVTATEGLEIIKLIKAIEQSNEQKRVIAFG